jgi:hypothetical protein
MHSKNQQRGEDNNFFHRLNFIDMTPVFILSIVVTVAIVGSLAIVLIEHVRRHDKAEKTQREMDGSENESITDSEAGFDWKRAA